MKVAALIASVLVLVALVVAGLADHPRSPSVLILGAVCIIAGFVALQRTVVAVAILGLGCVIATMGSGNLVVAVVSGWIILGGIATSWVAVSGSVRVTYLSMAFLVGASSFIALALSFLIGVALRPGPEVVAGEVLAVALVLAGVLMSSQRKDGPRDRPGRFRGALVRMSHRLASKV